MSQGRRNRHQSLCHLRLLLVCLLAVVPVWAHAAGGALDFIEVNTAKSPAEIQIHFTQPLHYVAHRPVDVGDLLHIQLQPVGGGVEPRTRLSGQEFLSWRPTSHVPLFEAAMDVDSTSGFHLTLRFTNAVQYWVRPTTGMRSLIILVQSHVKEDDLSDQATSRSWVPAGNTSTAPDRNLQLMAEYQYALNLQSSIQPVAPGPLADEKLLSRHVIYTTEFELDGRMWHRLRLGFFRNESAARSELKKLQGRYPDAWVTKVSPDERNKALSPHRSAAAASTVTASTPVAPPPKLSPMKIVPDPELTPRKSTQALERLVTHEADALFEALLEEARQAMAGGNYSRAIQIYTKILQSPPNPYQQDAQEFLGLARERNRQFAHAKAEYERYLEQYPEGDSADRVRQRMLGLITAVKAPKPELKKSKRTAPDAKWDLFGGISQFYRRNQTVLNDEIETVNLSGLFNNVDLNARRRSADYDIRLRLTGDYIYDFLDDGAGNQNHVTSAYVDVNSIDRGISARVGRQNRSTGGVLGRFDGAFLGYEVNDKVRVNAVLGYPVFSPADSPDPDRILYGMSLELGTFSDAWDFTPYIIEQNVDGVLDRRAVGLETHYFDPKRTLVNLVDYDVSYSQLNNLFLFGSWTLDNRLALNATLDYRKSPLMATYNALIGQPATSIEELVDALGEDTVRQLALDRTSDSTTLMLGAAYPLTEKLQLTGDITATELSATVESGGVEAMPGTDLEFYYSTQLIGSSILRAGDSLIIGLRFADATTSQTTTLSFSGRYPVTRSFRISPRLRLDYRTMELNSNTQWVVLPSVRMDYRRGRYLFIEFEAGYELNDTQTVLGDREMTSHYFSLGYRSNF